MTDASSRALERTLDLDRQYLLHSWSVQSALQPIAIESAHGCTLVDFDGREILDFSSQLVNTNIGHTHPKVVAAIREQAGILPTVAPSTANLTRGEAAKRILEKAGPGFSRIFFTNGGADANENAIRMARLMTGREKVLSTYRSYHGNTGAAIVATGDWRRVPNEHAHGHVHFFGPFPYRTEFWSESPEQEAERALRHLERVVVSEGPESIAAILLETIPGTAGVIMPPPAYLPGVQALCRKYGILLILDEVMAGFGRTGRWFAFHDYEVDPDLVTFAKGVNSGYVPVGGVMLSAPVAEYFWDRMFPGGLTYSGHPLAMASIVATLDAMTDEGIVEHARHLGDDIIGPGLHALAAKHDIIGEVRGVGVFWALDLVMDRETREPVSSATVAALKAAAFEKGLLLFTSDNRIHVVPPCIVTDDEARHGLAILDEVLAG